MDLGGVFSNKILCIGELLTLDELDGDKLKSFKIIHFGSATVLMNTFTKTFE
ncbi:hypothetical protein LGL55_09010 [Clostridium tagluense]|uniref:hypothetical protein n=1 Tax=Clostridium tagluense TaxID=360422 RepID=UPI001C0DACFE|nr:hypothetical protein [Clostridium tagluense]MBU3128021.1 hypothetical protein [Clostridium tagluense]MCB2321083.1 hypothetical protein [Clostridium tagluense]MCB2335681.1 hypothetical protein [Clostridium tagluense]MCB2364357.1 hypothetical protein [Clostridium tagluense]